MSNVDERIVSMKIDNKQFLSGVKSTQSALTSLNKSVDTAGNGAGMTKLGGSVDTVKTKFSALNVAAMTAVATITNKVVNAGISMVKSLTLDPIMAGFGEYQKNLNSIQTIMANTGAKVDVVNKYLGELNHYSDKTIYNFGTMADAIGKFTSAGVKLDTATSAIKGMANVAALSGSDVNQLNSAMYQMSQALATGTIKLQDWNSVVNAGMGGKNLQGALKTTAESMGINVDAMIKKYGSFRDSLTEGQWLTTKVFTQTMDAFTNDLSVKDLIAKGYTEKQAKYMKDLAQRASDAATKIKTFPQMMDVIKESIGSGWAKIFQDIFGDFDQSVKLWTGVGTKITDVIGNIFGAVDKMLLGWRKLGGYEDLWAGFGHIFGALGNLIHPFVAAFQSLLPTTHKAGSTLAMVTDNFEKFTGYIEKATEGTGSLTPVMTGLADILKIGFSILGGVIHYFTALIPLVSGLAGGVLSLVGSVANVVAKFIEWVDLGPKISGFFDHIIDTRQKVLGPILDTLGAIIAALGTLINGDISGFTAQFKEALTHLGPIGEMLSNVGAKFQAVFESIQGKSSGVIGQLAGYFAKAAGAVQNFGDNLQSLWGTFSGASADKAHASTAKLTSATTAAADGGSKFVAVLKAVGTWIKNASAAVADGIGKVWDSMSGWLSGVDKMDLVTALTLIFDGAILLQIRSFIKNFQGYVNTFSGIGESISGSFDQVTSNLKTMQTNVRANILMRIAISVGILAASLWVLSKIPADKLKTSLMAVSIMIVELVGAMALLNTVGGSLSMPLVAAGLVLMATSLTVLAGAVLMFGNMDTGTIKKGLISIAAALAIMVVAGAALSYIGPGLILGAGALVILSVAMSMLIGTILLYEKIKWGTLLDGLAKMAVVLAGLGLAAVAISLLAPGLLIASAALGVLSVTLTMLLGTILLFSKMDWGTFGKGLGMIALALVAIGVAALVAAPGVVALGVGAVLLGAGLLAAGVGMTLFAAGLGVLVGVGTAAAAVIGAAIEAFAAMLPLIATQMAVALTTFLDLLAKYAPKIRDDLTTILNNLIQVAINILPKLKELVSDLISDILDILGDNIDDLVDLGTRILEALLQGIDDKMNVWIDKGSQIIKDFISGMGENAGEIIDVAGKTIMDFLHAVDAAVQKYAPEIGRTGRSIGGHLISGLVDGLVPEPIQRAFSQLVDRVVNFFKGLLGIHSPSTVFADFGGNIVMGLVKGIGKMVGQAVSTVGRMASDLVSKAVTLVAGLPGKAANALGPLGHSIGSAISNAFNSVRSAVSNGIQNVANWIGELPGKIRGLAGSLKSAGSYIIGQLLSGISSAGGFVTDMASGIWGALKGMINGAIDHINDALSFSLNTHIPKIGTVTIDAPDIGHLAKGTDYWKGGLSMVGEVGPELVSLPRGASVINNKNLMKFTEAMNRISKMQSRTPVVMAPSMKIEDPTKTGMEFGANLIQGLRDGLNSQAKRANDAMSAVGNGVVDTITKVLDIHSPSRVLKDVGINVGKGFIAGLTASLKGVIAAGKKMAQYAVDTISKTASQQQLKADAQEAKAQAYRNAAALMRQKAHQKGLSKEQKKHLEAQARAYDRAAKTAQQQANATQKGINAAEAKAAWQKKFDAADEQGKADMLNEKAKNAAAKAEKDRQHAIELAKEADIIRAKDAKKAKQLEKQAAAALRASEKAAKAAKKNADEANLHAAEAALNSAGDVQARIDADKAAVAEEDKLSKMTDAEKQAYYQQKADAAQADSDAKYARAQELLDKAKKEASTDAKQAQKDVEKAQQLVDEAEAAKEAADQATDQAQQYADSVSGSTADMQDILDALKMPDISIASSGVYGAQNMFDSYAKALAATSKAAEGDKAPSIQFVQNNTSPEALSPTEVYRQSKNLLSNAERKLTGALS